MKAEVPKKDAEDMSPQHLLEQQHQMLEVQKEYYSVGDSHNFNMADMAFLKQTFSPQPDSHDLEFRLDLRNKSLTALELQELALEQAQDKQQQMTERNLPISMAKKGSPILELENKMAKKKEERQIKEQSWLQVSQSQLSSLRHSTSLQNGGESSISSQGYVKRMEKKNYLKPPQKQIDLLTYMNKSRDAHGCSKEDVRADNTNKTQSISSQLISKQTSVRPSGVIVTEQSNCAQNKQIVKQNSRYQTSGCPQLATGTVLTTQQDLTSRSRLITKQSDKNKSANRHQATQNDGITYQTAQSDQINEGIKFPFKGQFGSIATNVKHRSRKPSRRYDNEKNNEDARESDIEQRFNNIQGNELEQLNSTS